MYYLNGHHPNNLQISKRPTGPTKKSGEALLGRCLVGWLVVCNAGYNLLIQFQMLSRRSDQTRPNDKDDHDDQDDQGHQDDQDY